MENPNGIVTLSMLGIEGKGSVQVEIRDCNTFHLLLLVPSDEVNLMSARSAVTRGSRCNCVARRFFTSTGTR